MSELYPDADGSANLPAIPNQLAPGVPVREWVREDVVPSSLAVVEGFLGRELNTGDESVLDEIRALTSTQACLLFYALHEHRLKNTAALRQRRRPSSWGAFSDPAYGHLREDQLHANDAALFDSEHTAGLTNVGALKHAMLYCDRLAVRDPLFMPHYPYLLGPLDPRANPGHWLGEIAQGVDQLLPLAPLIRSGAIVLQEVDWSGADYATYGEITSLNVPGYEIPEHLQSFITEWIQGLEHIPLRSLTAYSRLDRFLAPLVLANLPPPGMSPADIDQWTVDRMQQAYPEPITYDTLLTAVLFSRELFEKKLSPITANKTVAYHLIQTARVMLDGEASARAADAVRPAAASPAVAYGIPPLSEVGFDDIARLRQDDTFITLRAALNELAGQCATSDWPTYAAYRAALGECAADQVRPAYEQLQRALRRSGWLGRILDISGKGVGLGLDAMAHGAPVSMTMGKPYEYLTGAAARKEKQQGLRVAQSILTSIMRMQK